MKKSFVLFLTVILCTSCLRIPEKKVELENRIKFTKVPKQSIKIPRKTGAHILGGVEITRNEGVDSYLCYQDVSVLKIDPNGRILIKDGESYFEYAVKAKKITALSNEDELVKNNPGQKSDLPDPASYTKNIGAYKNHKYKWHYYFDNENRSNFSFVSDEDTDGEQAVKYIVITSDFASRECQGGVILFVNGQKRKGAAGEDGNVYFCDKFDEDYIYIDKYIMQDDKQEVNPETTPK